MKTTTSILALAFGFWITACFFGCGAHSSDTHEDDQWGDTGGDEDTAAFEKELREKHLREVEQRESIERLAASKGKSPGVRTCPPAGSIPYACRCFGAAKPGWTRRAGSAAWKDEAGFVCAVGRGPEMTDARMADSRAFGRAIVKILALIEGTPVTNGVPDAGVQGKLKGVESRAVFRPGDGGVLALARYRPDGWKIPRAVLEAQCPEPGKVDYRCDCPADQKPVWLHLQAWLGGDGYVYAVGSGPMRGPMGRSRARNRARSNLVRLLSGIIVQARPLPGEGGAHSTWSAGDLDSKRVERVAEHTLGDDLLVLVRFWVNR